MLIQRGFQQLTLITEILVTTINSLDIKPIVTALVTGSSRKKDLERLSSEGWRKGGGLEIEERVDREERFAET